MTDQRDRRLAALHARLADEQLPALLVTHPSDIRYCSGFSGTAGVLVVQPGRAELFTDFRYRDQAEAEAGGVVEVTVVERDLWARVWKGLRARPGTEVGFDAETVTVTQARSFTEADLPWTFRPVAGFVRALRERKDATEVAAIRAAATLVLEALTRTFARVRAGQSEREVAVILESALRRLGSEWHPFPTMVASGPRSALPHARTGDRVLTVGDLLLVDCGATVDGYCADITRTVVLGLADARQRRAFSLVQEAQQAAGAGLRAGLTGDAGDALARRVIEAAGFGEAFGHALGHGLGLEVHEAPRLGRGSQAVLPPRRGGDG
ncbi:MAG: Xaa-Pro peptidase family protein [Gemmatimonadales bacterium]